MWRRRNAPRHGPRGEDERALHGFAKETEGAGGEDEVDLPRRPKARGGSTVHGGRTKDPSVDLPRRPRQGRGEENSWEGVSLRPEQGDRTSS